MPKKKLKKKNVKKSFWRQLRKRSFDVFMHRRNAFVFVVIFNVFIASVFVTINILNYDLDMIDLQRVLFNQPHPEIQSMANEMLEGYPMQSMAPYIALHDRQVAAYLIAIAKKESQWGKRSPKLNGEDCFNYWGFRRKSARMGSGGHTCFDNQEQAVHIVGKRIADLIKKGHDTPAQMVVWKCGRCDGPAASGAQKWIQDVDFYYQKMID